ncbi:MULTISPECIES: DUF5133 domain-containing protein [unclassified Streptomyces]
MPNEPVVAELLSNYRLQERRMLRNPADAEISASFRDAATTLCVLMGRRTALEAVRLAESYLGVRPRGSSPTTA